MYTISIETEYVCLRLVYGHDDDDDDLSSMVHDPCEIQVVEGPRSRYTPPRRGEGVRRFLRNVILPVAVGVLIRSVFNTEQEQDDK